MILKGAKQVHYDSGPNMTPLVDVVMVILIFLMLAGSFGTAEHFMASSVPVRPNGSGRMPLEKGQTLPIQVDVQVSANGDASILGTLNREPDPDKVAAALQSKLGQLKAANAADPTKAESIEAVLHPALGTRWANLAPLYDAALRAKFSKVSLALAK